jgi:hypothetical protein
MGGSGVPGRCLLEHDPEKWKPVFRKDHAQTQRARATRAFNRHESNQRAKVKAGKEKRRSPW